MKYSKATNYALHTMVYLLLIPDGKSIGVRPLAEFLRVSPTYLSKILTKLVKAGFIESATGVNGGYKPIKNRYDITFLDVIHAIEGPASMFNCNLEHIASDNQNCLIEKVMVNAELKMVTYLKEKKIKELTEKVDSSVIIFINNESK
ncbi:Rrf2 family transcriptional regulator [Mesobacillus foraminis]|uniref:BadM/Rrf2 family transcriptional regulator n=1 Tax=Mesobacillus foraminis TaxID=279826 RepID=A0A4R2B5F3_9BACI|nr:Rrf2 family transcriptional regulator [Mesobacillus foraminis]TCN20509.1 BadM/Rrf2 family transcriptional regulator [Mesobacillus foraminis]